MHIITSDGARICDSVIGIVVEKWVYGKFFFQFLSNLVKLCKNVGWKMKRNPNTQICH